MSGSDEYLLKGKYGVRKKKETHTETQKKRKAMFAEGTKRAKNKKAAKEIAD